MSAPNAFTVGHTESYEQCFRTQPKVTKIGPRPADGYEGGYVFRTREAAQGFIDENGHPYSVYGLVLPTGWEVDVSAEPHADGVHRLLRDAEVVRLGL